MAIEIPKGNNSAFDSDNFGKAGAPMWFPVSDKDGKPLKPLIRCNCGRIVGIGLHNVHSDGTVTASFYHRRGTSAGEDPNGCEWHVFLKLLDYDRGEFLPEESRA